MYFFLYAYIINYCAIVLNAAIFIAGHLVAFDFFFFLTKLPRRRCRESAVFILL